MKNKRAEEQKVKIAERAKKRVERKQAKANPVPPTTGNAKGKAQPLKRIRRMLGCIGHMLLSVFSNLRFSLSLRIAIHYSFQLLKTTFMVLLVVTVLFIVAQIPTINTTLDTLAAMPPANGSSYSQQQLIGLPLNSAYILDEPFPDGIAGMVKNMQLSLSELDSPQGRQLLIYRNTVQGGLVAAFSLRYILYVYSILIWTLVGCDVLRVLSFLRGQYRLNRVVLKPISEITDAAAALSANNLSNRINIAGTKNELKDLATVINNMLDRIERSYNSQKQFVSDASHELRTPIAVIQGYTSMLERWGKTDKEVLDEAIVAISQETAAMKELVERLLFLARHDKKTLMLEMEIFDPAEIMSAVLRDARLLSSAHTFALAPLQHCLVNGDKGMLKQLMRILVDNAIKYTPAGGSITLGMQKAGNECILSVKDTGQGMSAEELPRIFDRFYRSEKARVAQSSGHGLGLSIARIIVVAHGGRMTVRSKEGAGTTFRVILPVKRLD